MIDVYLSVNGVELPTPSKMLISDYDISSEAKRNARGYLVMDIVRHNVHKLEITWKKLTFDQYKQIRDIVAQKVYLSVAFYIPEQGKEGTLTMYVGDREVEPYSYVDNMRYYLDVPLHLIEH